MQALKAQTDGFLAWWSAHKASRAVEERIQRRISRLFGDVGEQILAEINERGVPVGELDRAHVRRIMNSANEDLAEILNDGMVEGLGVGGADAAKRAKQAGLHLDLALPDPVFTNIADHVWEASKRTMARVSDEVMDLLAAEYAAGKGIKEVARTVGSKFSGLKAYEAKRIARTEINYAQNLGTVETLRANGIGYIQWWTASDDRVRGIKPGSKADHVILHGRITNVTGGDFGNGMQYPGDRGGPMGEWMNCRCTGIAWFMPPGKMAPPGLSWWTEADLVDAAPPTYGGHQVDIAYEDDVLRSYSTIAANGTNVQIDLLKESGYLDGLSQYSGVDELNAVHAMVQRVQADLSANSLGIKELMFRFPEDRWDDLLVDLMSDLNFVAGSDPEVAVWTVLQKVSQVADDAAFTIDDWGSMVTTLSGEAQDGLARYTSSSYFDMNYALRNNDLANITSRDLKAIKGVDRAFDEARALPEDIHVWRGSGGSWCKKVGQGDVLTDQGIMSTTTRLEIAQGFSGRGGTLFDIRVPKGKKAIDVASISHHTGEAEIVLPRGTSLKVTGIEYHEFKEPWGTQMNKYRVLICEVI